MENTFRLRLKETNQREDEKKSFIVFKRRRSGAYIPSCEKKSRKKKNEDDIFPYFDTIPDELCLRIYYFMTAKELCQGPSQVSKRLHDLSENPSLWKLHLSRELPVCPSTSGTQKTNWKSYFIKLYKKQNCPLLQLSLQFSNNNDRQVTCIDRFDSLSTKILTLNDLHELQFEDIFMKKLKWDIYITIGISVRLLDTSALLQEIEFGIPLIKINQLRKYLEQAWRHQKLVQSIIKQNLKENGWTILDNCSRRNQNSERTIPKRAADYLLMAKVQRDMSGNLIGNHPFNSVVFINYPEEDFSRDLNLLKNKFSEKEKKKKKQRK